MWDLGRLVAGSAELTALFDAGVDGLLDRLDHSSPDGAAFRARWDALLAEHGHRGPNEWDMRPHSWTTRPELALGMIERLRYQSDDRSPHAAREHAAGQRERLSAELLAALDGDPATQATLAAGLASAGRWLAWRELGKNACIRLIHEAKLAMYEPPFIVNDSRPAVPKDYVEQLNAAIAAGRPGDAVEIFMTKAILIPPEFVAQMRNAPMSESFGEETAVKPRSGWRWRRLRIRWRTMA